MPPPLRLVVGSYTDGAPYFSGAAGQGITLCSLDPSTGRVGTVSGFRDILNPSYLAKAQDGTVYAVSESFCDEGSISAFRVNESGNFSRLWSSSSRGLATCHVNAFSGGVAATSYLDGKLVLLDHNGAFLQLFSYEGSGPIKERQESSHPHASAISPCGKWLLVADLGADCLWVHKLSGKRLAPPSLSKLPSGTGPRHFIFHRCGTRISVLGELDGRLHTGIWDEARGAIDWFSSVETTAGAGLGQAHASAIRQHPLETTLFTANRSRHELVILSLRDAAGPIRESALHSGGEVPRDFAISPDGTWMVVACQGSHALAVHRLDPNTGLPVGNRPAMYPLSSPTSILFL